MYKPDINTLSVWPNGIVAVGFAPSPDHLHENLLAGHVAKFQAEMLGSEPASKFRRAVVQQAKLASRSADIDAALRTVAHKQQAILDTPELDEVSSDAAELGDLDRQATELRAEKQSIGRQQQLIGPIVATASAALSKLVQTAETARVNQILTELQAERQRQFTNAAKGNMEAIAKIGAVAQAVDRLMERKRPSYYGTPFMLAWPLGIEKQIRQDAGITTAVPSALAPADEDADGLDTWQAALTNAEE